MASVSSKEFLDIQTTIECGFTVKRVRGMIKTYSHNVRLLKQLESGFKRTINWNKCHPKFKTFPQNRYLHYLFDSNFQGVDRLFVLPFENETDREVHTKYYLLTEEIKDYNVVIDGRNFFDQPIRTDMKTYDNIRKIVTGQGDGLHNWIFTRL